MRHGTCPLPRLPPRLLLLLLLLGLCTSCLLLLLLHAACPLLSCCLLLPSTISCCRRLGIARLGICWRHPPSALLMLGSRCLDDADLGASPSGSGGAIASGAAAGAACSLLATLKQLLCNLDGTLRDLAGMAVEANQATVT